MEFLEFWNLLIFEPMLNGLIILYNFLFRNFGITIIVFTIIVRVLTFPLTLKQLRATKGMQTLTPKLQELQKKHAKDRQKLQQEQMKLYKEHGMNPMGCLGPMVIQLPIWIGLYQSIMQAMAPAPEGLIGLSQHLYNLPLVHAMIPLNASFLWLNLAVPDPLTIPMPILVGGSMWVQQKMTTTPSADPKQASMNNMMQWMMPAMFGFFTLNFASGLALYWAMSNLIGIVMQGLVTGWEPLLNIFSPGQPVKGAKKTTPEKTIPEKTTTEPTVAEQAAAANPTPKARKDISDGKPRSKRKDRRRSHRTRSRTARR